MKKFTIILLVLLMGANMMFAQIGEPSETKKDGNAKITLKEQATFDRIQKAMSKYDTYEAGMREVTRYLDMSKAKTGFLYDLVYPVAKLDAFNEKLNVSSNIHFRQAWQEILCAKIDGKVKVDNQKFLRFDYMATQKSKYELGLICGNINTLDKELYEKGVLKEKDGYLYSTGNPFRTKQILIMSPLRDVVQKNKDGRVFFSFGNAILNVSENKLKSLTVSFENLDEINLISEGKIVSDGFDFDFKESGSHRGKVKGEFLNGEKMETEFIFVVTSPPPPPSADAHGCISDDKDIVAEEGFNPFPVYGTDLCFDCNGAAEYRIYYGNFDCQLKKPILITDGIDFGDQRDLTSIYNRMNEGGYADNLRDEGYDVVVVNWNIYQTTPFLGNAQFRDGGSDYVERNAETFISIVEEINAIKHSDESNEPLVVIGPSMGGLITRVGLSLMEQRGTDPETRLWVSNDAPHLGANVPIGIQDIAVRNNVQKVIGFLDRPAAKQLLLDHYSAHFIGSKWNGDNIGVHGAPGVRDVFQSYLDTQIGYPAESDEEGYVKRKIALVNGSLLGKKVCSPHDVILSVFHEPFTVSSKIFSSDKIRVWVYATPDESYDQILYKKNTKNGWMDFSATDAAYGGLDGAPGCIFPEALLGNVLVNSTTDLTPFESIFGAGLLTPKLESDVTFMPTKSTLGFGFGNLESNHLYREVIGYRNLTCTGETPFDSYFGERENTSHVSTTIEKATWLLEEIHGNFMKPTVYLEGNVKITGSDNICSTSNVTYSVYGLGYSCGAIINSWSVPYPLEIVSTTSNSVTVKLLDGSLSGKVTIKANFDFGSISKDVFYGAPPPNFEVFAEDEQWGGILFVENPLVDIMDVDWHVTLSNPLDNTYSCDYYINSNNNSKLEFSSCCNLVSVYGVVSNVCGTATSSTFEANWDENQGCLPSSDMLSNNGAESKLNASGLFELNNSTPDILGNEKFSMVKTGRNRYKVISKLAYSISQINQATLNSIYGEKSSAPSINGNEININGLGQTGRIFFLHVEVGGQIITRKVLME